MLQTTGDKIVQLPVVYNIIICNYNFLLQYAKPEAASALLGSWCWAVCPTKTCRASYKYEIEFWYTVASCWISYVNYILWYMDPWTWSSLFIYIWFILLNFSSSDCKAMNGKIISEWWIHRHLEESGHVLIIVLFWHLSTGNEESHEKNQSGYSMSGTSWIQVWSIMTFENFLSICPIARDTNCKLRVLTELSNVILKDRSIQK
jgi:hypothetical protein